MQQLILPTASIIDCNCIQYNYIKYYFNKSNISSRIMFRYIKQKFTHKQSFWDLSAPIGKHTYFWLTNFVQMVLKERQIINT